MKNYIISVNGKSYNVSVEEVGGAVSAPVMAAPQPVAQPAPQPVAQPAPQVSAPKANVAGVKVESPMPGTILKICVNVGDEVSEGQTIAVLEAMKMENEIPAPEAGKIVSVDVTAGSSVETGTVLAVIG